MRLSAFSLCVLLIIFGVLTGSAYGQNKSKQIKGNITGVNRKAVYKIKFETNHIYVIDLESKAFDTFLEVRDASNKLLAENDDGGKGLNSRLVFVPSKSATYQIVASPLRVGTGPFTLTIREDKAYFAAVGKLTRKDALDRVRTRSHHKVHVVKLSVGNRYTIDLISPDFDTYLRVEDASGTSLAQNDDGGEGLNSRLSFRAEKNGNYRIIATAFDGNDLGSYSIIIRKE